MKDCQKLDLQISESYVEKINRTVKMKIIKLTISTLQ